MPTTPPTDSIDQSGVPQVLLVDDRPENLLALEAALDPLGLRLVRAPSARLALAAVEKQEFAVILLDVQMPEMDGYEVARRIKEIQGPHLTPIIFVTARDRDPRQIDEGYASGAVDYLFKPLDPDALRGKVESFVRLYREHRAETDRRRAEEGRDAAVERERLLRELELERTRLVEIFRQTPSILAVIAAPDYVFELVNDAYLQTIGHRDVVGRPLFDAVPELRGQGFRELLDGVIATGEPYVGREVPITLVRTPGAEPVVRYFDFVYLPRADATGNRTGVIAHGSDVTDQVLARREVERERDRAEDASRRAASAMRDAEQARADAVRANELKSAFLATMSHELRTPINAIIGYTQLMQLRLAGPLTEQQNTYLERLTASGRHLLGLVDDVLDLSKIEAGEVHVVHEHARTATIIDAVMAVAEPIAAARSVRLVDGRPGDVGVPFVGDPDRVRQIVLNLVSNGIKFTNEGGSVTVTCGVEGRTPANAAALCGDGPWTFVEVRDTGIGIAPAEQHRIFEPFHQVEQGHTRTAGGTGLGLAISRRLARLMGGDLSVVSVVREGSVFTLWLPAAASGEAGIAESVDERIARTERTPLLLGAPGLGAAGAVLRGAIESVLRAYVSRLRRESVIPSSDADRPVFLEDHTLSFLADLAQTLVLVDDVGAEGVDLLRDGSAIQRTIAEQHGIRRRAHGWTEAAVRRDFQILREEIERAVRAGVRADIGDPEGAIGVLVRLIDRGTELSVLAWRRGEGEG